MKQTKEEIIVETPQPNIQEKLDVHKIQPVNLEKTTKPIESPKGVLKQKKLGAKSVPKCCHCKIKIGIYGMVCKCGQVFCSEHRLPENHVCSFDFKKNQKDLIEKQNPKVSPSKFNKI
jgi:predicted nucleic acid binding AN1-type Zn finger protein